MGELIVLDDYRQQWREALKVHTDTSTLSLFVNARTGEAEVVQTNDEGESISTLISSDIVELFREALQPRRAKSSRQESVREEQRMVCRHRPGDPDCSSHPSHPDNPANVRERYEEENRARARKEVQAMQEAQIRDLRRQLAELQASIPPTPDSQNYVIEEATQVSRNMVMKVRYPNCAKCAFEGTKIMVFLGVSCTDAIKWRKIDPHFREDKHRTPHEAPSPAARFPGTADGWNDAMNYAFTHERKQ